MNILGISCFYHDAAAAIVSDGRVVAAAQEERFTRRKHDPSFPANAIASCLKMIGGTVDAVDAIAYYEIPSVKRERQDAFSQHGHSVLGEAASAENATELLTPYLQRMGIDPARIQVMEFPHHASHAASAYYPAPFSEATILTLDGVGEWDTLCIASGTGDSIAFHESMRFPDSIGLLYAAFTDFCGFKVNSGEYKLMGLAPYGVPRFRDIIREKLLESSGNSFFHVRQDYFSYIDSPRMTNELFAELFGARPRRPEQRISQKYMDIAASIQAVTEELVLDIARHAKEVAGYDKLCLAGGVALNCVANGKLLRSGLFSDLWIQPAAGDAGGAIGAACLGYLAQKQPALGSGKTIAPMAHAYLGTAFDDKQVEDAINASAHRESVSVQRYEHEADLVLSAAQDLRDGKAVGWFQGRMEFGPRALGARSIIANPMLESTQRDLNLKVKFRESFRPFAPLVKADRASDWFDLDRESPYMLLVAPVAEDIRLPVDESKEGFAKLYQPRSSIPAVTHVDYSARVQTLSSEQNPRLYAVLDKFEDLTGCPVVVNTSFNVRGEPIVCTPDDALRCFYGTNIDTLYIENYRIEKGPGQKVLDDQFAHQFEMD